MMIWKKNRQKMKNIALSAQMREINYFETFLLHLYVGIEPHRHSYYIRIVGQIDRVEPTKLILFKISWNRLDYQFHQVKIPKIDGGI